MRIETSIQSLLIPCLIAATPVLAQERVRVTDGLEIPESARQEVEQRLQQLQTEAKLRAEQQSAESRFLGLGFGLGLGISFDLSGGDRIEEAIVDANNVVRVSKENNEVPRIVLETHRFFRWKYQDNPITGERITTVGQGPFVAIQSSDESVLDSFAMGWMVGLRRTGAEDTQSSSFNIGIGPVIDREVKTLGDGIVENQPLPQGETSVRLKEESRLGLVVLTSFSF